MAKKPTTDEASLITVVAKAALYEGGVQYKKGDTFQTTAERAESLGDIVSTADTPTE